MTRTKKSIRNILYNLTYILVTTVSLLVVRVYFLNSLGAQYLGLNGLFSNILSILSLAELGIGTAILFKLYKPLAKRDENRVRVLMLFLKKVYRIISVVILLLGLLLLPFINFFIKEDVEFINVQLIFLIYLMQTASTYMFFAYKSSLLKADQKEFKIAGISTIIEFLSAITQVIVLIVFKSFVIYLLIIVLFTILRNILISFKVNNEYPYIREQTKERLSKEELREMTKDFGALFLYKINAVIIKATDNIVMSIFLGLSIVGLYSNYMLITNALRRVINPVFDSIKASLGNFIAENNNSESYELFKIVNLITVIIFGGASIGIFILSNLFIKLWLGDQYIISSIFPLLLSVEFYLRGLQIFLSKFRSSMGLFQQAKYRPVFGIIINVVLSLILVRYFSINGVIMATILSSLLTYMWFDPLVLHKYGFNKKVSQYYLKNLFYSCVIFVTGTLAYLLVANIHYTPIIKLFVSFLLTSIIIFGVFLIAFIGLKEFKKLFNYVKYAVTN